MDKPELTREQLESQDDQLRRAGAFEEMVRTKGWEYLQAYFQNRVQALATEILLSDQPITDFESERRELMGIKKMLGQVSSDLEALEQFRTTTRE